MNGPRRITPSFVSLAALVALAAGCSLDDSGYQPGELGNGGFYFSCDDNAASCSKYSNDSSKFPKAVSLGSTFKVRFEPKKTSGVDIHFNESAPDRGIIVQPVADFITRGPRGLTAVKGGYATLASRDASGQLIDYTVIRVAKPDALVVYPEVSSGATPIPVATINLKPSDSKTFSAFAQQNKEDLAGSLQIEWTSSNPSVVTVQNVSGGKATISAVSAGNATLTATGGTFSQTVPVVVAP